jgi:8-amino-7-oxononanoate synthase
MCASDVPVAGPSWSDSIEADLNALEAAALLRKCRVVDSPQQPGVMLTGRRLLNFSSNDYLGLAADPHLREAAKAAIDRFGVGSGASRLVCGTMAPHRDLEERLAAFKKSEAALTFSSGYAAALGTLSALARSSDVIVLDKLCHASLIDGARLSGATIRVFPHNDLNKLESHLRWARKHFPSGRLIVVTESVFSMDGDLSPLEDIVDLKDRYGAFLLLDEAHAVGVRGRNGRGVAFERGLSDRIDLHMGTLSKALGGSGGYVCGRRRSIELLTNKARSFIYSTAPGPAAAATSCAALDFLLSEDGESRRQKLAANLVYFARECTAFSGAAFPPASAIIPVILGSSQAALSAAESLLDAGFLIPAIRFPTVAKNAARLRVTLSALHEPSQIRELGVLLNGIRNRLRAP